MNQRVRLEHIFRHEYGFLVASLSRRVGMQHIDSVEDAVQHAMMKALGSWPQKSTPDKPTAWLYQVAYRQLLSEFRRLKRRQLLLVEQSKSTCLVTNQEPEAPLLGEMGDALLRMLFVACHEAIPVESQLVFTLKSLCGFSIREIALRLFISEANAYKRFSRAKQHLQNQPALLDALSDSDRAARLPMVHRVLYLVFTEGYLSSHPDTSIRIDLSEEAIRLTLLLSESTLGDTPETDALLALMYFNLSRMSARQDDSGALLLLEQQDRSLWDKDHIKKGLTFLQQSARGDAISRYHIEAGIAAEHCLAPSFKQTRWEKIASSYELLEHISPSLLHRLNRAIAVTQWQGPQAGLVVLQSINAPNWLDCSYHWHAVHADLHYRCGNTALAHNFAEQALQTAPTVDIKHLLHQRLKALGHQSANQSDTAPLNATHF